jgi:hypothetical protein
MKTCILVACSFMYCLTAMSQIVIDTTRIDTVGAVRFRRSILNATSLTGETVATYLTPNTQQLCFNRRMVIKASTPMRGTIFMCMYFNTDKGYTAYFKPSLTLPAAICDININDPSFNLTINSLKGNVFIYNNLSKGSSFKHYVTTRNTVANPYLFFNDSIATPPLMRKTGSKRFLNGKVLGVPYKIDGGSTPRFYLYGETMPIKIRYKKFLGHLGIGYLYGEDGLFFSLQLENSNVDAKVLYIENKDVCFDTTPFVWQEGEQMIKIREEIETEQRKLERQNQDFSGSCASQQAALFEAKKTNLRNAAENLNRIENGNINLSENNNSLISAVWDQVAAIDIEIAKFKLNLCSANNIRDNTASKAKKIRCINEKLTALDAEKAQILRIIAANRNDKQKAFYEINLFKANRNVSSDCLIY